LFIVETAVFSETFHVDPLTGKVGFAKTVLARTMWDGHGSGRGVARRHPIYQTFASRSFTERDAFKEG
jgi:hypothetical protein